MSILAANRCAFCGAYLPRGQRVCAGCLASLPYADAARLAARAPDVGCDGLYAPFWYKGSVRAALGRFKFRGGVTLYRTLARAMNGAIPALAIDAVVFAPMLRRDVRRRGYNQAELLARELARLRGVPCRRWLQKRLANETQHELPAAEREANVAGAYGASPAVRGLRLLLVDDIFTTGSTMRELAVALLRAGAEAVYGAVVAVTPPPVRRSKSNADTVGDVYR